MSYLNKKSVWAVISFIGSVDKLLISLLILGGATLCLINLSSTGEETILVSDKKVVANGTHSEFLILTNEETFSLNDSFLAMNYSTSEQFNLIKKGNCYQVKYRGIRIPFLSMFKNIEKFKEVECLN